MTFIILFTLFEYCKYNTIQQFNNNYKHNHFRSSHQCLALIRRSCAMCTRHANLACAASLNVLRVLCRRPIIHCSRSDSGCRRSDRWQVGSSSSRCSTVWPYKPSSPIDFWVQPNETSHELRSNDPRPHN